MLKNKKGFLITITLLIIAVMGGSAIAYTLAGNGGKESETIKTEVNQSSASLSGNLGFMEYVSNIDLIIEDSNNSSSYRYKIVHVVPKSNQSTTVSKYVSDDVFRTLVINGNKERDAEMPKDRVSVTRLELDSNVKTTTAIGDNTAGQILGAADLIYIESPDYNSYRGKMSDDIYLYLSGTYLSKNNKPMILDKVSENTTSDEELVTNSTKAFVNEVADNYIYSPVFAWPTNNAGDAMQSADDFFAGKDKSNFFQFVVSDEQPATGKVLCLTGGGSGNNWIAQNFVQDNIAKIYYGKADNFPDEFELTNLDISALTSDYLDNNKFDFIIIENSSMDSVLSDDVYQKLVTLANGKQYIIFDGTNVIEKKNDEGGNNYLKLLESASGSNSSRMLVVDNGFFDGAARKKDGAKKIADLINGTNYRDSDNSGRNGKKFRVLEIQPCYPIDLARAEKKSSMNNNVSKAGLKGNYYTDPEANRKSMGKTVDEVDSKDEYYAFELSVAKIAAATGLKSTQIEVDSMSTDEFISTKDVVLDTYDLVYIGGNASAYLPLKLTFDYRGEQGVIPNALRMYMEHKFVTSFVMYTHTGSAYKLNTIGSYNSSGGDDYIPANNETAVPYGQLGNESTSTVMNGNDLTYSKYQELIDYIDAGMPIIFSDDISKAFEKIYNKSRLEKLAEHDIDPDSNIYSLLDYAYKKYKPSAYAGVDDKVDTSAASAVNIVWKFDKSSERKQEKRYKNTGNIADKDAKYDYLTLFSTNSQQQIYTVIQNAATRPSLKIVDAPLDYERGNELTYNTKKDNCMNIKVKLVCKSTDKAQKYAIRLYVDKNGNGLYGGNDDADELEDELVAGKNNSIIVDVPAYQDGRTVTSPEVTLTYNFEMDDFYGIVNWKAEAVLIDGNSTTTTATARNSTQCDVKRGYAYFKREDNVEKKDVRILQVMPIQNSTASKTDLGAQDLHTLYMCTECQMAGFKAKYNLYSLGGDNLYYHTTGSMSSGGNNNVYLGLHEHKFGIVSYDSSLKAVTSADAKYNNGCDNWNDNLADSLSEDYNFDLDIMMMDEYHKASWIVQANTVNGKDRLMSDTSDLPAKAKGYESDQYSGDYRKDENGNEITPIAGATWIEYYETKRDAFQEKYEAAQLKLEKSGIENTLDGMLDELKEKVGTQGVNGYIGTVTADSIAKWQEHKAYYNYFLFYVGYENINPGNTKYDYDFWVKYIKNYNAWVKLHDEVVKYQQLYQQYSVYACTSDEWLDSNYDMVVLGFATDFGGKDLTTAECSDIKTYVQEKGGSVLLTHDSTTRMRNKGSVNLTNELRSVFGLDRFHATVEQTSTGGSVSVTDRTSQMWYLADGDDYYGPILLTNKSAIINVIRGENKTLTYEGKNFYNVEKINYTDTVSNGGNFKLSFNVYDSRDDYNNGIKSTYVKGSGRDFTFVLDKQGKETIDWGGWLHYDSTNDCYYSNDLAKLNTTTVNGSLKLPIFKFSDNNKYFMTTKNVFSSGKLTETVEDRVLWQNAIETQTAVGNSGHVDFNIINLVGNTDGVGMLNTNNWAPSNYRYVEMNLNDSISWAVGTTYPVENVGGTRYATQINEGVITIYPFQLDSEIAIAPTHFQTLAADLEDPNMTVWYALAGSDNKKAAKSGDTSGGSNNAKMSNSYYAASPNDGMDNYFLYTYKSGKGTVNYCGAGNSVVTGPGKNNLYERLLYINLVTDSVKNSASRPKITLYDKDDNKITEDSNGALKLDKNGNYVYNVTSQTETPEFNFDVKFSSLTELQEVYMFYDLDYTDGIFDAHKTNCVNSTNGKIEGIMSNKYKQNESHVLVHHYQGTEFAEKDSKGNDLKLLDKKAHKLADKVRSGRFQDTTFDRLQLNSAAYANVLSADEQSKDQMTTAEKNTTLDYFAKYGGSYTYLVIWAKDKAGKTASVRIKIQLEKKLFDLTDNTTIQLPDYQFKAMYTTMDITDRTKYNL